MCERVKTWCIGKPSAQYVAKMEDVLEVYARPFDPQRPVVCLDEGAKELRSTPRGDLPMEEGQPKREDYEYERQGKANLFLSVEPLAGKRRVRITERHTGLDLADELKCLVDEDYPEVERIVLVTDNLNTHGPACLYTRFEPQEARRIAAELEWHYTPEHGSWLNMAEIELSCLQRQCLSRRIAPEALAAEVAAWEKGRKGRNEAKAKILWQFTTTDARIKLRRLYPVLQTGNPKPKPASR